MKDLVSFKVGNGVITVLTRSIVRIFWSPENYGFVAVVVNPGIGGETEFVTMHSLKEAQEIWASALKDESEEKK